MILLIEFNKTLNSEIFIEKFENLDSNILSPATKCFENRSKLLIVTTFQLNNKNLEIYSEQQRNQVKL